MLRLEHLDRSILKRSYNYNFKTLASTLQECSCLPSGELLKSSS